MAAPNEPKVPVEKPDPEAAGRRSAGAAERPGVGAGGVEEAGGGTLPPGGPVGDPQLGASRPTGGNTLTNAEGEKA